MLDLRAMVHDGVLPLLGPVSSVGGFHHGAAGYYLLAPAVFLTGAAPTGVILEEALLGIAAVAATWWLGGAMSGGVAAVVAGLLAAASPAWAWESTFVWNPNPVPLFAAIAVAAAWRGRQVGRARWWALSIGALAVVANLQILGAILAPPVLGLLAAEAWAARRRGDRERVRAAVRGLAAGLGLAVLVYLPFLVSEVQTGFAETHAILAFLTGGSGAPGGSGSIPGLLQRLVVIALRVLGWPFVRLVTDAPLLTVVVVAIVAGSLIWLAVRGRGEVGSAARWLAGSIAWSIVALAIVAPSLATVVLALPNDHYHSFADPLVIAAVALTGAELVRRAVAAWRGRSTRAGAVVAGVTAAILLAGLVGVELWRQPPPDPDGGWPGARAAGQRVIEAVVHDAGTTAMPRLAVLLLPDFEPPTGISYPIVRATDEAGASPPLTTDPGTGDYVVLGCDRAFEVPIGAACGGPAETAWLPRLAGSLAARLQLVERFDLSPRTSVSIYRVGPPAP